MQSSTAVASDNSLSKGRLKMEIFREKDDVARKYRYHSKIVFCSKYLFERGRGVLLLRTVTKASLGSWQAGLTF